MYSDLVDKNLMVLVDILVRNLMIKLNYNFRYYDFSKIYIITNQEQDSSMHYRSTVFVEISVVVAVEIDRRFVDK